MCDKPYEHPSHIWVPKRVRVTTDDIRYCFGGPFTDSQIQIQKARREHEERLNR